MPVNSTPDTERRRDAMLSRLTSDGSLLVNDAALEWGVHAMTVRRDFDVFVSRGVARRVRGGIIAVLGDSFEVRRHVNAVAKEEIARKLADLVEPASVIALDASTTISVFAESLAGPADVTVVTNGRPAFDALRRREGIHAFLTGGEQEEQNDALVGPLAESALAHFVIGTAFISTMGLTHDLGANENTLAEVSFKRALRAASARVVLAIDSSKLDAHARFRSLELSDIDVLVTELHPGDARLNAYREQAVSIL